jgi:hypothetical protein
MDYFLGETKISKPVIRQIIVPFCGGSASCAKKTVH